MFVYCFEQVTIVFEKIDLPIVSIHKILLHNNELFHLIVTIITGMAQNQGKNLYNAGFNKICGFAGFFHKCINALLSNKSLHILPIAGYFT